MSVIYSFRTSHESIYWIKRTTILLSLTHLWVEGSAKWFFCCSGSGVLMQFQWDYVWDSPWMVACHRWLLYVSGTLVKMAASPRAAGMLGRSPCIGAFSLSVTSSRFLNLGSCLHTWWPNVQSRSCSHLVEVRYKPASPDSVTASDASQEGS